MEMQLTTEDIEEMRKTLEAEFKRPFTMGEAEMAAHRLCNLVYDVHVAWARHVSEEGADPSL